MSRSFLSSAVGLLATAALFQNVAAQVTTDCQPLNKTCPADPAFGMDFNFNFNSTPNAQTWETTVGPVKYDATNGATFTLTNQGDSPTIRSKFYFFFGRVEINMKASPGTGIISSIMLLSDDLDEIDWEFMGGNSTHAETNYFGKGHQDFHNAIYYPVSGGVQDDYHNYTLVWTQDALDYYIDTQKVRTLLPADANNTLYYPQTPMRLSIGIWAGGDPTLPQGTRDWAGGTTDYTQGPFNMYVKNAHVTDYSSGSEYTYGDQTGSWESIKITTGNSTAKEAITATPAPTLAEKWNALPSGAKTAVYAGAGGVGALIILAALFYCIKQRRRGAREAKFAELKAEEEKRELDAFRKAGIDPDSFREEATEYNAKDLAREGVTQGNSYSIPNSPVVGQPTSAAAIGAGASVAAAAAGARSPMPLLRDGQSSPRMGSPGPNNNSPYTDRAMYNNSPVSMRSPPSSAGPMRTPSPGMGQQQQRSYTGPNPNMRVASPGPARGGYGDVQRMASPGPVGAPQPQRSFTTGGYGDMQRMASPGPAPQPQRSFTSGGYGPQPGASPYGQNGGNDQGYWGGNNYR